MQPAARLGGRLVALLAVFAAASWWAGSANAASITLVPGAGFSDATPATPEGGNSGSTLGQQRTIVFNAAAAAWGAALTSNQQIKIAAQFSNLPCSASSGVLGSAGATSYFSLEDGSIERWFPVALAEALAGENLNGTTDAEISANFNARIDANDTGCLGNSRWYYGLVGPAPAGTLALYPTVMHEIGHGLGFAAFLCTTSTGCTFTSPTTPYGGYFFGVPDVWSDFLRDNNINGSGTSKLWSAMTNAERVTSFTHDPLLVWDGPNVTARLAAFGQDGAELNGGRMRMYAPSPFQGGSSISHFHEAAAPNLLMEPIADADVFRQTDLTDCLFEDIGWINPRCDDTGPTLNEISNPAPINEDAGTQVVNLGGIGDGSPSLQTLSVTAVSGNLALLPNPSVSYTSPQSSGSLSYAPLADRSGTALVLVTVTDSAGSSLARTFSVTVNPVNDAPVINSTAPTPATEDVAYSYNATRSDVDGPGQVWSLLGAHTCGGSVAAATGAFAFTPTGPAPATSCVLALKVCDNGSPSLCGTQSTTLAITPVNDAPVINSSAPATAIEDTIYTYNATRNDPDSASQNWTLLGTHSCGGSVVAATGVFTFTPSGPTPPPSCVVALRICDGGSPVLCDTQSTTVSIQAVNDAPVISNAPATNATEDTPYQHNATRIDTDGPGQHWSLLGTHTCGGSISASSGAFGFTPAGPTPPSSCVLALRVCDGAVPDLCASQSTTIDITPVNDAPVIDSTAPAVATEDTLYTYDASRTDPDGTAQDWSLHASHSCGGSVGSGTGVFSFTPAGPTPPPSCVVALRVCDGGSPNLCDTQATTIQITPVNDAPIITNAPPSSATEDTPYSHAATRSDPDGPLQAWSLLGTHSCGGDLVAATGAFEFTPPGPTPAASCVIALRVCDGGTPVLCATQSTSVTITAVNDAPSIDSTPPANASLVTPYVYNAFGSDPDGPAQVWSLHGTHTCGGSVDPTSGAFSFSPGPAPPPSCVLALQVCDGGAPEECAVQTATLTIGGSNGAPTSHAPATASTLEDSPLAFSGAHALGVSDGDNASLQVALAVDSGRLSLANVTGLTFTAGDGTADPSMTFSASLPDISAALASASYAPPADFNGGATLDFGVSDDIAAPVVRSVALQIVPVADAVADAVATLEDTSISFDPIGGSDGASADAFEAAPLLAGATQGGSGTVVVGPGNTLSYTPGADFSGVDAFTYTVHSGGVSESADVSVEVIAVNDAPRLDAIPDPDPIAPDSGLRMIVLSGIDAGPGEADQALVVTAVSDTPALIPHPTVSYASPAATGSISFQPVAGQIGSALITVTVSDDGGAANGGSSSVSRTFRVIVVPGGVVVFRNGFETDS